MTHLALEADTVTLLEQLVDIESVSRNEQRIADAVEEALRPLGHLSVSRHGNTVVPLVKPGPRDKPLDGGEVWTYRDPKTGEVALLLFSDAANKPANLPPAVGLQSPAWLRTFLKRYESTITTVFLDIAGPHPMQAPPAELLKALEA